MILNFWTLIFVLLNCPPNGLCLNYDVASKAELFCRAVPWIGPIIRRKTTAHLQCWRIPLVERTGRELCVLTKLDTTRNYVHLFCRNCDTTNDKFSLSQHQCVVSNEEEWFFRSGASKRVGNFTKYIVHFINRTKHIDYAMLCSSSFNDLEWRTRFGPKYSRVFICSRGNDSITWKRNEALKTTDKDDDRTFARVRRNVLGNDNYSTTFQSYSTPFPNHTNTHSQPLTPSRTVQSPAVTSRNASVGDLCTRTVIVDCSTIFTTPTVVSTQQSSVGTRQLTSLTYFTTAMLRNSTHVTERSYWSSASKLASNTTSRLAITTSAAHLENSTQNTPTIANINNGSITVTCTSFITRFRCSSVTPNDPASPPRSNLPTTRMTTSAGNTKYNELYIGLIAGGGVVLFIIISVAMCLLIRRYRRIQALRRTAKHISYFNRFDCSSPWDEPDRFGGSKLSVFTLKNSKFDIDWDSTHDSKQ